MPVLLQTSFLMLQQDNAAETSLEMWGPIIREHYHSITHHGKKDTFCSHIQQPEVDYLLPMQHLLGHPSPSTSSLPQLNCLIEKPNPHLATHTGSG